MSPDFEGLGIPPYTPLLWGDAGRKYLVDVGRLTDSFQEVTVDEGGKGVNTYATAP